jgi:hypothetical protein
MQIPRSQPMPLYFFDMVESHRVQRMNEAQRWWYLSLIGHAFYSAMPGHIPNDSGLLWKLAGATTRHFFEKGCGPVLACFVRTEDGRWLYNERTVKIVADSSQTTEQKRVRHISQPSIYIGLTDSQVLDSKFELAYKNYPRHVGKRAALRAFYSACSRYAKQTGQSLSGAASFISHKSREFGLSPAGKRGVYTPHMASWLNQDRFLDDWDEWQKTAEPMGRPFVPPVGVHVEGPSSSSAPRGEDVPEEDRLLRARIAVAEKWPPSRSGPHLEPYIRQVLMEKKRT